MGESYDDPFGVPASARPRPRSAPDPQVLATEVAVRTKRGNEALAARDIHTAGDLLEMAPRAYRDYGSEVELLSQVQPGREATVRCRVESVRERPTRRRNLRIVQAQVRDESGVATAVWFNQRYLARALEPGQTLQLRGEPRSNGYGLELVVKTHEIVGEAGEGVHTVGLVPVYDANRALSTRVLHELVGEHLHRADAVADPLPSGLRVARRLPTRRDALAALHAPLDEHEPELGVRRLAYEELLLLQLALQARRAAMDAAARAEPLPPAGELLTRYREALPFELTRGQRLATQAIDRDLGRTRPMRRLLLGDVGSGKTVVALHAMLRAVDADGQAALMAPTETLAQQHAATVRRLVEPLGLPVELVTSDVPAREKRARVERIASGDAQLVVGTHALLEESVSFRRLLVAVVDEQHRFGVEQRAALTDAHGAHTLHMTATPIPRSLALALYGDLDVTELRELPAGRRPVVTARVPESKREACYTWLQEQWSEHGRQAYIVCPLVEGSESLQARAVEEEHARLVELLAPLRVGLLHGKLRGGEKAEAMRAFVARETQVLVATTVIEVGVDVPNATAIVIEDADRFGLSQLHQLRGRVGRGAEQSYCFLFESAEPTDLGAARLEAIVKHASGFDLAELDLRMRGEGELAGVRQAGRSDLRFARLGRMRELVAKARSDARFLERRRLVDPVLAQAVEDRFGELLERIGRA
jgi:ATP-dependent DNA helicase RecG